MAAMAGESWRCPKNKNRTQNRYLLQPNLVACQSNSCVGNGCKAEKKGRMGSIESSPQFGDTKMVILTIFSNRNPMINLKEKLEIDSNHLGFWWWSQREGNIYYLQIKSRISSLCLGVLASHRVRWNWERRLPIGISSATHVIGMWTSIALGHFRPAYEL